MFAEVSICISNIPISLLQAVPSLVDLELLSNGLTQMDYYSLFCSSCSNPFLSCSNSLFCCGVIMIDKYQIRQRLACHPYMFNFLSEHESYMRDKFVLSGVNHFLLSLTLCSVAFRLCILESNAFIFSESYSCIR